MTTKQTNLLATLLLFTTFSGLFIFGLVIRSQTYVNTFNKDIYHSIENIPSAPVALVFGAGIKPDGTMSDAQKDRVIAGIELYKAGKVRKLVMTADNGDRRYDEVTPMHDYAIANGVPEQDVILDYAGFRTYESCYRARDIFGLWDIIAVSQEFHLTRINYICNTFGINTIGFVADRQQYLHKDLWAVREFLAKFKAWIQVEITKPPPRHLGPKEDVF